MLKFQAAFAFLRDNVLSAVAAFAALIYGYFEFANKQANQEKQFVDQFVQSIERFKFPEKCTELTEMHELLLEVARSASERVEDEFGRTSYNVIINKLQGRFASFKGGCDAQNAPGPRHAEEKEIALARSVARSNIQWQEGARNAPAGTGWFTVVASLPQGHNDESFARAMICDWRQREPELATSQFQIWKTAISKSIAIVVDGEQARAKAAEAAQLIRANERFRPYFYDAFAQTNRNWAQVATNVECKDGKPLTPAEAG